VNGGKDSKGKSLDERFEIIKGMDPRVICLVRQRAAGPLTAGSENVDDELKTAVDEYLNAKPTVPPTVPDSYTQMSHGKPEQDPALYSNEACGRIEYPELQ
jgi:hypothetical protein